MSITSFARTALLCASPLALLVPSALVAQQSGANPLIPRELIFGNPSRSGAQVSPDGKHVSWLAPVDGVMNVWVAPIATPTQGKAITADKNRGIAQYFWAPDGSHVLYLQDAGGNENFHVYAVPAMGGTARDLTPVAGTVRAQVLGVSELRPDVVLVGLNDRNPQFFDPYEINYRTGEKKLVMENPGYGGLIADNMHRIRFGMKQVPGGGSVVDRLEADGSWKTAFRIENEDAFTTNPLGFDRDGKTLFMVDSRGRDKAALVRMDPATLKTDIIAESDRADIQGILPDPRTRAPIAYSVNYLKNEWTALTPEAKADLDFLRGKLPGEFAVTSITDDGRLATVASFAAEAPGTSWLYDRQARTLTKLFDVRPDLSKYALQPMTPVEIQSRDGKTLVSYLTLPAGADTNGDGKADRAVPLVLNVHGGPWARDNYGYNGTHQWLANRGYAVLSVNFRGSTGFGKDFVNSAIGEWSGAMHQDLIDAVDWAIRSGVTFTPDRFACGVDIVGPSNLKTLMESFPAYWRPILEGTFYKHIGDPNKPEDVKRMMAQSPISRVDAIRVPLLIGQGANDPRVVKAESDQIVEAMRAKNLPVTYVNYPDEGHGFQRPANRLSFFAITEGFLSGCLGGKAEPIGDDFAGSSLQVLEGAQHVPGLAAALPKAAAAGAAPTTE